jgi:hypothetical protein
LPSWDEQINSHPLHQSLKVIDEAIAEAISRANGDADVVVNLQRAKRVSGFVASRIVQADSFLLSLSTLTAIQQQLDAATSACRSYTTDQDTAHIERVGKAIDATVPLAGAIPVISTRADVRNLGADFGAFRRAVETGMTHWKSEAGKLSQQLSEMTAVGSSLKAEIESQKGLLSQAITQYQATFTQAEQARQSQFLATQQARADEADKAASTRREQLLALLEEHRTAFVSLLDQAAAQLKQAQGESIDQASEHISKINNMRVEAEGLLGVIGNTGVVGGFNRVANQEQRTARVWAALAVAAFIGLIVTACVAFLPSLKGQFTWGAFAGRVYVSLTFGLLAAFSAYQSEQHFAVERRARKLETELASLGPFIADLTVEERQAKKSALVDRIFGQQDLEKSEGPERVTTGTLKDVLEMVFKYAVHK